MIIDTAAFEACHRHLIERARAGEEGVGLLSGPPLQYHGQQGSVVVHRWTPLDNVADFPRYRYEVDPGQLIAAYDDLESADLKPFVLAHSHLHGGAGPSLNDVRFAADPQLRYMIVDLGGPRPHSVLWRLDPGRPVAEQEKIRFQVADLREQKNLATDLTRGVPSA